MAEIKVQRSYRDNGQLIHESNFFDGARHGIDKWWYENGNLSFITIYIKGRWSVNLTLQKSFNVKSIPQFTREQWLKLK